MPSQDAEYFRMRSMEETELAYAATDKVVARRHAELALRYQALHEKAEGPTPPDITVPDADEVRPDSTMGVHGNGMGRARTD